MRDEMPTLETASRAAKNGVARYATFSMGEKTLPIWPKWVSSAAPASTPTRGGAGGGGGGASRAVADGGGGLVTGACTGESQNSARLALRSSMAPTDKMAAVRRAFRRSISIL